jgi:hypothetical protein
VARDKPVPVTHVGTGRARVERVASNRRIVGPDGKIKHTRFSATEDPKVRAEPEGLIDPFVQVLTFWDGERPVASLSYYACHPQVHWGYGTVSSDFPGLARAQRDKEQPGVFHVHFNGAGGNVTVGKYNDGAPENRAGFVARLAAGMKEAFASVKKVPVKASDVEWRLTAAALPLTRTVTVKELEARIEDKSLPEIDRLRAARTLTWARRCVAGDKIDMTCLRVGPAFVLHMPGELFIEYQLTAQKMRPGAAVMMAAYGDYGMGYIGTAAAYDQGGYETGRVSRVDPAAEEAVLRAMRELLK